MCPLSLKNLAKIIPLGMGCFLAFLLLSLSGCEGNKSGSSTGAGASDGESGGGGKGANAVDAGSAGKSSGNQDIGPVSYVDSPLVDRFLKLVSEISTRAPKLNRERDRRGKLRLALGAQLGEGCMQDVKVKTLEVLIEGQKLGDADVSSQFEGKDNPPEGSGRTVFEFSFGDSTFSSVLTFNNEETAHALFSVGTRKSWVPENQEFLTGQIQRIKIKKLGQSFASQDLCDGGNIVSTCKNKRRITEKERYILSSLKVKVNGELIYERGNISHIFANYGQDSESFKTIGQGFSDDHININEAYVKMKQRDDCTALQ